MRLDYRMKASIIITETAPLFHLNFTFSKNHAISSSRNARETWRVILGVTKIALPQDFEAPVKERFFISEMISDQLFLACICEEVVTKWCVVHAIDAVIQHIFVYIEVNRS